MSERYAAPDLLAALSASIDRARAERRARHDCATCPDCPHDGQRCCGCYDGACCKDAQ